MLKVKRIMGDINKFNERGLDKEGIYLHYNEDNLQDMKYLIVGPDDTPYKGGFYLFNVTMHSEYPFKPPKVKYISYCQQARINPNLYQNGKVCLSVLGTWSGPSWVAAMNLGSLAMDILIRLNKNPLQNEPGYENDVNDQTPFYNKFIMYKNIEISVIRVIEKLESLPESFQTIIKEQFIKNYQSYIDYLTSLKPKEGTTVSCRYGNSVCTYDPNNLISKLEKIYADFTKD